MEFTGFRDETFAFFASLSENNTEEWFEQHQAEFEEHVQQPFEALVRALAEDLRKLSPALVADDDDLTVHFSEMKRSARSPEGTPPLKTSYYAFFWDRSLRRLSDGNLYVGVGADGVTIGFSIYDFGAPQAKMRRVFKPRIRRHLGHLDDYIKASYLRRGFDFRRYVRAAGRLGMREVDAFPATAPDWENTLGWVVSRHIHTESSRLTPGSFLAEVRESFARLYPLYVFASDPREDFQRVVRVPGNGTAKRKTAAKPRTRAVAKKKAKTKTKARAKAARAH